MKRDPRHTPQPQPALGRAIRRLREKEKSSQERLAGKAGITAGTLSLIERGEANPTWGTVTGIAAALDVSLTELARLSEEQRG